MTDTSHVTDAGKIIEDALCSDEQDAQVAALDALFKLFTLLSSMSPQVLSRGLEQTLDRGKENPLQGEVDIVRALIDGFKDHLMERFHVLLRILHPRWINGAERMLDQAPPFSEVKDELMGALDSGVIDLEGFSAIMIGRYGPDAKEVLPQLIDRLREFRTDCSKAPGLTWAVYMIGGISPAVKEVLLEVARGEDSCPHSRPVACEILEMNEIEID